MKGIVYYPVRNEEDLIKQNITDFGIEGVIKGNYTHKNWDKLKKEIYGDDKFIVHKNMSDSYKETVKEIKSNAVKIEDFIYNPYKLYELLNDYSYMINNKFCDRSIGKDYLSSFVTKLVKNGANIEEVKMYVLASIFFNIDSMVDRETEDDGILKAKMDNSMRLSKTIDLLKLKSPYEDVFLAAKYMCDMTNNHKNSDKEFERYVKTFDQFDVNMLLNIARCKIKNYFLQSILNFRYLNNLDYFMNNKLAKEIYEVRTSHKNNRETMLKEFKYSIRESFKDLMIEIMRDEHEDYEREFAEIFYKNGFTTKIEYEKLISSMQVLHNCKECFDEKEIEK